MQPINLAQKLATFQSHYKPHIVSEFNGHEVMVAKLKGDFVWHHHDDTDDFFLVIEGELGIRLRIDGEESTVTLSAGELFIVPAGVEHQPFADEECQVMLIERQGTPNTGNEATAVEKHRI